MFILIVSGLSGSGKSTALRVLEDLDYFCLDNLPPQLINTFLNLCEKSSKKINKIALGIDIREGEFLNKIHKEIKFLKDSGNSVEFIFLESSNETLIKRFKETRRKHPLAQKGNLKEGIEIERLALKKIRKSSDHVIDTSLLNIHQLKKIINEIYGDSEKQQIIINIMSYGYKYGIPDDTDLMIDVRFLPNPQFIDKLKHLDGTDKRIQNYVLKNEESTIFLKKLVDLLDFLFEKYILEGKSYLNLSIGCTGGKHRSVVIVEELVNKFKKYKPNRIHRDKDRPRI